MTCKQQQRQAEIFTKIKKKNQTKLPLNKLTKQIRRYIT